MSSTSSSATRPGLLVVHPDFPWHGAGEGVMTDGRRLIPALKRMVAAAESGRYHVGCLLFSADTPDAPDGVKVLLARLLKSAALTVPAAQATSPQDASAWLQKNGFPVNAVAGGFWRNHCVRDMARVLGIPVERRLTVER